MTHNFYFKFIPEALAYNDPDVNALVARTLEDPMHEWFNRPTAEIKADINNGTLPAIYSDLFEMK